jgi:hypothetical protein
MVQRQALLLGQQTLEMVGRESMPLLPLVVLVVAALLLSVP